MINTTDRPIVLQAPEQFAKSVVIALDWAIESLRNTLSENGSSSNGKNAFGIFTGEVNRRHQPFDEKFIQAAFDFVTSDALNQDAKEPMRVLASYMGKATVAASGFAATKRGFKLVLVELWRQGALILPSKFTPGPHFQYELYKNEILKWLLTFDPNSVGQKSKTDTRRLYFFGPRLLMTTTWFSFEDVDINEIAELHQAWMKYRAGEHPHTLSCGQFPWTQLTAEILKFAPSRASFSDADLVRYSAWALQDNRGKFEVFTPKKRVKSAATAPRPPPLSGYISHTKFPKPDLAVEVKSITTHDAVLAMLKTLGQRTAQMDWLGGVPTFPGREHIDVENLSAKWLPSIRAWLHHRKNVQGYRSDSDVRASLNALVDYLFLYLPWWKELYPNSNVNLPQAPKDFLRFQFVSCHQAEEPDSMPLTLLQFINIKREKIETRTLVVKHLNLFFKFLEAFFRDDETVAGVTFRNPIDDTFDTQRGKGKKNKTNKSIIPRHIYGYMLFYLYAVEQFGQHLLERSLKGDFSESFLKLRDTKVYRTEQFGFTPTLTYRGSTFSVTEIPNLFSWSQRRLVEDAGKTLVWIPHMSALRICIVGLEMGLRFQSIQWLDRDSWDSLNHNSQETYIYKLLVNTDKTKVDSWTVPMVFRVRDCMKREHSFQKLFVDYETSPEVFYEGNEHAPFKPIRPLFKSATSANPILDQAYYDAWTALQVNFELFYKDATGERHIELFELKPVETKSKEVVVKYIGREATPYCPISIRVKHTPHACRATFATNRQGEGTLELSDCADLLGHEGPQTTAHYTKFSAEQLEERLQRSDVALLSDYSIFDVGADSGYVRADTADSALVQSFSKDRKRAIENYRFMPSMSLWTIEDGKMDEHDGLTLLKEGPMSHIRFRETHICPVGEECPADIVQGIGAAKRCGICPLAMRCIDHLTAIAAKKNQLIERIKYLHSNHTKLKDAGEPVTALDAIWDELQLDINEWLGWNFCEETLNTLLTQAHEEGNNEMIFHADRPDIVRRHLKLVTRQSDKTEFLLHRLAESNAFPSMTSPQVQVAAASLRRKFSAGQGLESFTDVQGDSDDVRAAVAMLGTMMKASGLNISELSLFLNRPSVIQNSNVAVLKSEVVNGQQKRL